MSLRELLNDLRHGLNEASEPKSPRHINMIADAFTNSKFARSGFPPSRHRPTTGETTHAVGLTVADQKQVTAAVKFISSALKKMGYGTLRKGAKGELRFEMKNEKEQKAMILKPSGQTVWVKVGWTPFELY